MVEELSAGAPLEERIVAQIDESASIVLRYVRAADEGIRARNLRLLARAFRRQLESGTASADRFYQTAAAIEGLTDAEIVLLGRWLQLEAGNRLQDILTIHNDTDDWTDLLATAVALMRTGLTMPNRTYGGVGYDLTPAALRLELELRAEDLVQD